MNLYDMTIRHHPEIFLTKLKDAYPNLPHREQLKQFSGELAEHLHLLDDRTLLEIRDHLNWDLVLRHIPCDHMHRLLHLPFIPWKAISHRNYIPLEILDQKMAFIRPEAFGKTIQSLEAIKKYYDLMSWSFVSRAYPLDHPVFTDRRCVVNHLNLLECSRRVTEEFLDRMDSSGLIRFYRWEIISQILLSKNQDLIEKYIKYVRWDRLRDLTLETVRKYAGYLSVYNILHNRHTYLSVEEAENILSLRDLLRDRYPISVRHIAIDRDFIIKYRDDIDFETLRFNEHASETLLISCIEYIPWSSIFHNPWKLRTRDAWVRRTICNGRGLFPTEFLELRTQMSYPVDWEEMQNRIDETTADVTVEQIRDGTLVCISDDEMLTDSSDSDDST